MIFDSWTGIVRVLVVGAAAYLALVVLLRISGKRTLSKMNAFDFVVTVAMGSVLANIFLSPEVALAEGVVALAVLIGLQFAITWTSVRWPWVRDLVKSTPTLLFYRGEFFHGALRRERVTEEEVLAAIRSQGPGRLEAVTAVVLETDGTISAIAVEEGEPDTVLRGVRRPEA
jgi:uncharacterized membrane protein YcaP (DUF421 family)